MKKKNIKLELVNWSIIPSCRELKTAITFLNINLVLLVLFFTSIMSENAGCEKLTLNLINIGVQLELLLIIKRGRL